MSDGGFCQIGSQFYLITRLIKHSIHLPRNIKRENIAYSAKTPEYRYYMTASSFSLDKVKRNDNCYEEIVDKVSAHVHNSGNILF